MSFLHPFHKQIYTFLAEEKNFFPDKKYFVQADGWGIRDQKDKLQHAVLESSKCELEKMVFYLSLVFQNRKT